MSNFMKPDDSGQAAALPNNLEQHPLSAAFPAMDAEEFLELSDSIKAIGVQNPITIFEGKIIDGWHRYRAALSLDMHCPHVELDPEVNPQEFVIAQNSARRHITKGQMSIAATAVYKWQPVGANQHMTGRVDTEYQPSKTTAEMAAIVGVHSHTIRQAKVVISQAEPEVLEAVKQGAIGLPKAAAIAKLPREAQVAAIAKPLPKTVVVAPPVVVPPPQDNTKPEGDPEDYGPSEDEIAAALKAEQDERKTIELLLDADDKLAAAFEEIKRLKAEVAQLERSRDGHMNGALELTRLLKARDRQIAKLLKELEAFKKGGVQC